MFQSVLDIFKIGLGPSSSHTIGPMIAASNFLQKIKNSHFSPYSIKVSLHGSLAFTGKGHATDKAIILGLSDFKLNEYNEQNINKIVNSVEDLELRERQIRDLAEIYDALQGDVLPQLRKAIIVIRSFEPKRTDEEIATLSTTTPEALDVKELLFSATLTNDAVAKEGIYNKAVELHNDWRGYNNIACMHIANGDLNTAMVYLNKAVSISKENSDISTNKGIIAARIGELANAQVLFDKANTSEFNQATLDIRQGEYKKAARFFKNGKSHNAVLAQVLNGKNSNCNEATAACHYLNAIAAARSGENDAVISNLTNAIIANSNYKAEATIDLEFLNLRTNEAFIALTK